MNKSSEQLAANHATAATPSGSAGRKHHVLVVDDDEAFRRVIARLLRRAGFRIAVAADGAEAMRELQDGNFDAVVSDVDMPHVNGIELLRHIRSAEPCLPVLLLTGRHCATTTTAAARHNATACLSKPVERDRLLAELQRGIQARNAGRPAERRPGAEQPMNRSVRTMPRSRSNRGSRPTSCAWWRAAELDRVQMKARRPSCAKQSTLMAVAGQVTPSLWW